MATYKVRDPQGNIREISGPDGASDAEVIAQAQKLFAPKKAPLEQIDPGVKSPVSDSTLENVAAGVGAGMINLAKGAAQRLGFGPSKEEVDETRRLEKPLMDTFAGAAGNVGGNVAATLPLLAVPGGQSLPGAQLMGLTMGALQPTGSGDSVVKNMAVGEGASVVGKLAGDKVAQVLTDRVAGKTAEASAKQGQNALRDAVLERSKAAGYVLPKSEVAPSFLNNRLESIAGKAALKQDATLQNQQVTNRLARELLGLEDDVPLTKTAIEIFRNKVAEPYRQVAALDDNAATALEALKKVRNEAQSYWTHYSRSADPESLAIAKGLTEKAAQLESVIDDVAASKGQPALLGALREARKKIAQSYDLQRATNETTGDVSAAVLGRIKAKGKPVTDQMGTIAEFNRAFPKFSGNAASTPAAGVSKVEAILATLMAGGGAAAGGPAGIAAGALPLMSGPTRNYLLSDFYQNAFVKPAATGATGVDKVAAALANSKYLKPLIAPAAAASGVAYAE